MLLQQLMAAAALPGMLTTGLPGLPCFVPGVPPGAATQLFQNPLPGMMGRSAAGGDVAASAEPVPVPPPLRN